MEALCIQRINYVFYHLKQLVTWDKKIEDSFTFEYSSDLTDKVIFPLSDSNFEIEKTAYIDEIPILFTTSGSKKVYNIDSNNNLVFNHDLLKSAFYLLSGIQEYKSDKFDVYNRFPFQESIQRKLGIITKPIVNYYFNWIIDGLVEFSNIHSYSIKRKKQNFNFIITHDIDYLDKYDKYFVANRIKQFLGLIKPINSRKSLLIDIIKGTVFQFMIKKPNPYWNFEYLVKSKPKRTFRQIFFFLEKDQLHIDSYYKFSDKRIKEIFAYLFQNNCEIGLHGTVASAISEEKMNKTLQNLNNNTSKKVISNRQHRLHYTLPKTALIHENCGIKEDFTLGFAAHEGFRNSYCHPFKLFDFENERIIDVWQYPLNVMDTTLLHYQKLNYDESLKKVKEIILEVKKFKGTFTILWHNNYIVEKENPDLFKLYNSINEIL